MISIPKSEYDSLIKLREQVQLAQFRFRFANQLLECAETTEMNHWPELVQKAFRFSEGDDSVGAELFKKRGPV